jgi:hypothetical protein
MLIVKALKETVGYSWKMALAPFIITMGLDIGLIFLLFGGFATIPLAFALIGLQLAVLPFLW